MSKASSGAFYYMCNHVFNKVPSNTFRNWVYTHLLGYYFGNNVRVQMGCYIYCRNSIGPLTIGDESMINRECVLDSRGSLHIGKRVNISPWVQIYTASHDLQSSDFAQKLGAVRIGDYCWISTRSTILPSVTIGEGSVVAAGAVVSKDVPPYTIVAGIPAKPVGERNRNLNYVPVWDTWFQ